MKNPVFHIRERSSFRSGAGLCSWVGRKAMTASSGSAHYWKKREKRSSTQACGRDFAVSEQSGGWRPANGRFRLRLRLLAVLTALAMSSLTVYAGGGEVYDIEWEEDLPVVASASSLEIPAKSAILIEQTTGKILYEMNADEKMPPASITKIMTMLLVMEALDAGQIHLEDMVTASPHACSMGGTQIWLEPNEQMSVHDLLKATAVASANDAAVALGELLAGSEEAFVDMMNQRAAELGMTNTTFQNATGLDAEGHLTTARDIAIMSRELLKHEKITEYTTIWMDSVRDGKNELVNTNKMVRFYEGATGLKTGTTDGAGSCLSASATRSGLSLIAVTLGSATSADRFTSCRKLLDYGFAAYCVVTPKPVDDQIGSVKVERGVDNQVEVEYTLPDNLLIPKGSEEKLEQSVTLQESVEAPVELGQELGKVIITLDGEEIGSYPLTAKKAVERMTFGKAMERLFKSMVQMKAVP